MPQFAPADLVGVFSTLQAAGWEAILVGGQAVNLWARRYERDDSAWRELQPYTSRDLDYHGGLADARLAMKVLRAEGRLNTALEPGPNAAVLTVSLGPDLEIVIDILTGVYGVSAAEVDRTAIELSGTGKLAGLEFRVIHPLLLLEAKLASLRGLPQEGRQDSRHVRILTLVLREWLREQLDDRRAVLRAVERLAACAASPDGLAAFAAGMDILEAIPWEQMRSAGTYSSFFERREAQLLERIVTRRQRHASALGEPGGGDAEVGGEPSRSR